MTSMKAVVVELEAAQHNWKWEKIRKLFLSTLFFFTAILRILTYFWSDVGWLLPFVAALFEATAVSDAEAEAEAEFALPTIKNVSMLFSAKKPSRSPPWPGSTSKAPWRFSKAAFDTWTRLE